MKLSEIRSAIRKMKGNPSVTVEMTPGVAMTLILQKTPTLETLGVAYDGVAGDTGLTISDSGVISAVETLSGQQYLRADGVWTPAPVLSNAPEMDEEEDDLL